MAKAAAVEERDLNAVRQQELADAKREEWSVNEQTHFRWWAVFAAAISQEHHTFASAKKLADDALAYVTKIHGHV